MQNLKSSLLCLLLAFANCWGATDLAPDTVTGKKTVLITGGAGFIGSNCLEYLFNKHPDYQFVVLDKLTYAGNLKNIPASIRQSDRFQFVQGSICDFELVDQLMSTANYVVHFAAETPVTRSLEEDYVFFESNVIGTRTLMANLVKHAGTVERFLHISTSEVYGTAEYEPMDESHPLNPRTPYAASKAGADRLVYAYYCTFDIPAVIIRPFNNYGPRQHPEKMIPQMITSVIQHEPIHIHGSGIQSRDWIHVYDVAEFIDVALHTPNFSIIKNQVINIGTQVATSVLDVSHIIMERLADFNPTFDFTEDRLGQVLCHHANIDKAKQLLDWSPKISIEEGVKMTTQWYLDNLWFWSDNNAASQESAF